MERVLCVKVNAQINRHRWSAPDGTCSIVRPPLPPPPLPEYCSILRAILT